MFNDPTPIVTLGDVRLVLWSIIAVGVGLAVRWFWHQFLMQTDDKTYDRVVVARHTTGRILEFGFGALIVFGVWAAIIGAAIMFVMAIVTGK